MAKTTTKSILEPRINNELKNLSEVRVVYKEHNDRTSENDFTKVMSITDAFKLSKEYELDLIEINSYAKPPVVKLYDYSKYMYEQRKAQKQKNKNTTTCKEIQLKVNIAKNDLNVKVNKAKEFIRDGDKVKVVLIMRGRELNRRDDAKLCFYKFVDAMSDIAVVEGNIKEENNKTICILKRK